MERFFGAFVAFLLLGGGMLGLLTQEPSFDNPFSGQPDDTASMSASPDDQSDEPSDDTDDESGSCVPHDAAGEYLAVHGFDRDDYLVGAGLMDWSLLDASHTDNPFSDPLKSESAVVEFLSSATKTGRAAREIAGIADDYVPVQFNQPVRFSDNWYWVGETDNLAVQGGDLLVRSGDVWWLAIGADCEVDEASSIRAVCGNPGVYWLRPKVDPRV